MVILPATGESRVMVTVVVADPRGMLYVPGLKSLLRASCNKASWMPEPAATLARLAASNPYVASRKLVARKLMVMPAKSTVTPIRNDVTRAAWPLRSGSEQAVTHGRPLPSVRILRLSISPLTTYYPPQTTSHLTDSS